MSPCGAACPYATTTLPAVLEGTGDLAGAAENYRAARDTVAALAAEDHNDLQWQRDLVFCNDRLVLLCHKLDTLGCALAARTSRDSASDGACDSDADGCD